MRRDLPLRSVPRRHRVLVGVYPLVLHVQWCPAGSL
jgi:hypothetical protein